MYYINNYVFSYLFSRWPHHSVCWVSVLLLLLLDVYCYEKVQSDCTAMFPGLICCNRTIGDVQNNTFIKSAAIRSCVAVLQSRHLLFSHVNKPNRNSPGRSDSPCQPHLGDEIKT